MRVLFASSLQALSASGRQRYAALRALGHEVQAFALDGYDRESRFSRGIRRRVFNHAFSRRDMDAFGRALVEAIARVSADVVWLEKPLMLRPEWLSRAREQAPQAIFVCFQDDDPFGSRTWERPFWRHFIQCISLYDVHFVKREANLHEFKARGAKDVFLFMHGAVPSVFYPRQDVPASQRRDVVFVGTPLDQRVSQIHQLLGRYELPLHVYGNRWERTVVYWRHRDHFHPEVEADVYATVLSGSRIALGFLSSANRDEYSMRTFEIPSCGTMLLAQRTPTHQLLFEEGVEAEFFGSTEECADKCSFYLRNESLRSRIAHRGYERCLRPEYSLDARMREAFERLSDLSRT